MNEQPTCSCLPSYNGSPPNCRPECVINSDCASNHACINEKCRDPCPGSCGVYAVCNVRNHTPVCTCPVGYTGDPFTNCHAQPAPPPPRNINLNLSILRTQILNEPYLFLKLVTPADDPCIPSPCGTNAQCSDGICTCIGEYQGDPYTGCRPECILNSECSRNKACINQKCQDPCPGTCASNAICEVHNHVPMCHCPAGMQGNAFVLCQPLPERPPEPAQPCQPSPCGPNSQCQDRNGIAICSCVADMIGTPPACRPECISNSECPMNRACINQKCKDPCPGACGHNALCNIVNHNPICSCPTGYTGSPFVACQPIISTYFLLIGVHKPNFKSPISTNFSTAPPTYEEPRDPCRPSPCGANAQCSNINSAPSCTCLSEFIGLPPNCRPECVSNSECPSDKACINQKCRDPCPGLCGANAQCHTLNHIPNCVCEQGYVGDPFTVCRLPLPPPPAPVPDFIDPCVPNPCGDNAECRHHKNVGSCVCLPEYFGNPYQGCRPECVLNSDCPSNKACVQRKCQDPCPGTCGRNAECQVINHLPVCHCWSGYTGNPFSLCSAIKQCKHN